MQPAVYILANSPGGALYVGVTSALQPRTSQHRTGAIDGFTKRYSIKMLVYYELHATMYEAIRREKQLKRWHREWKIALIEEMNPEWRDLWDTL